MSQTKDGSDLIVRETLLVRKFANPDAHTRDEADAVLSVEVITDMDGNELERFVSEVSREDERFKHLESRAKAAEAAARNRS